MFKFLKNLFGSKENTGKVLDIAGGAIKGVGEWIDTKSFTPEEKSKALAEAVKAHLELISATANENSIRSITRRWLAWAICGYTLFWASVAMVFAMLGHADIVKRMMEIVDAFSIGWVWLAVVGFYFDVQLLRK